MATEKRLIDAKGKFVLNAGDLTGHIMCFENGYATVFDRSAKIICKFSILDAPTVDAVEVVRCKDCGNSEPCNPPRGRVWCKKLCRYMKEDGYCSEPERKANGVQG